MKKLLQLALAFSAIPICATAQVSVSTQFTSEQLVNNILLSSSCYTATNITSKTGTDFGSVNGIGYFQNNNSDFPFLNGIILSSGDALMHKDQTTDSLAPALRTGLETATLIPCCIAVQLILQKMHRY